MQQRSSRVSSTVELALLIMHQTLDTQTPPKLLVPARQLALLDQFRFIDNYYRDR